MKNIIYKPAPDTPNSDIITVLQHEKEYHETTHVNGLEIDLLISELKIGNSFDNVCGLQRHTKHFNDQWAVIEECFNWNNVHKAMTVLDWGWEDKGVPTVKRLKNNALELCLKAYKDSVTVSSGGFSASYNDIDGLYLEFVLESINVLDCI